MKITITRPSYGDKVVKVVKCDDLTADDLVTDVVAPLLLALGYHPNTVNEALGLERTDESDSGVQPKPARESVRSPKARR